jgi:hypothetical protein
MKRLVAAPVIILTACTITISPTHKEQKEATHSVYHKASRIPSRKPKPTPAPNLSPFPEQIHEQYKPLYEKLPPEPDHSTNQPVQSDRASLRVPAEPFFVFDRTP